MATRSLKIPIMIISLVIFSSLVFGMQSQVFAASNPYLGCPDCNSTSNVQQIPSQGISVTTNKPSYNNGDTITISGIVQSVMPGTPVSIQILDPNYNVVKITQVDANPDGKYVESVLITGSYWKSSGTYTIKVQYGLPNVTAQTTLVFVANNQPTSAIYPLQFGGQTYNIPYTIQGGSVVKMNFAPTHQYVFEIAVMTTSDGSISVTLPRSLLDAKTASGQDTPFAISIDGAEVKPQSESTNSDFRNITIQFLQGDQDIEIIGTQSASGSTSNSNNPYLGCPDCNDTSHIQQVPTTTPVPTPTPQPTQPTISKIPHWVKTVFNLYGQGQISDDDLISALKFLIQTGVIKVS